MLTLNCMRYWVSYFALSMYFYCLILVSITTTIFNCRNILLNYLIHKPEISYRQGMTDLLAPLLAALDDEAEAFWCFTKLIQSSIFYMPGKNHTSVKHQLVNTCIYL